MAMLENLGRVLKRPSVRAGIGVAGAAYVAHGLRKGLKGTNTSAHIYNTIFEDPTYDQEVFGTKVGFRELMVPLPGVLGQGTRLGSIRAGGVRGISSAIVEGFVNGDFISDYSRYGSYYQNKMPNVNGSLVFGLHNASQGG